MKSRCNGKVRVLYNLKSKPENYGVVSSICDSFDLFRNKAKKMLPNTNKKEMIKILNIVHKILRFNEQSQPR